MKLMIRSFHQISFLVKIISLIRVFKIGKKIEIEISHKIILQFTI